MMRNRWLSPWLAAWLVSFGLVAGCGGGSHSHRAGHWRIGTKAPAVVTGGQQSAGGSAHPPGWGLPPKGSTQRPKALPLRAVPTAEQWDTITLTTVPHGARYLAGYTSGFWPTFFQLVRLPWHPRVISIAVNFSHHAMCGDFEPGDMVPSQAAAWYVAVKNDPGMRSSLVDGKPCEYSSYWEYVNQVLPVLRAHGIPASAVWKWDADYTFRRHLDQGFNCTQWTDKAFNRNLDESTCTLAFLGYHPKPPPPPPHRYPYPVALMTSSENTVMKLWYDHQCHALSKVPLCVNDLKRERQLTHNIWVAKQGDHEPWGFRNRGIRFHVLTLIEHH